MNPDAPSEAESIHDLSIRLARFGDWFPIRHSTTAGPIETRMFYHGTGVAERMNVVREAITRIRVDWREYATFMNELRLLMEESLADPLIGEDRGRLDEVFSSSKEWNDRSQGRSDIDEFSVIRLYASDLGYHKVFRVVDRILRTNVTITQDKALLSAVFLVELLNIDLFNYVSVKKEADNFQGVVFRGVCISYEELQEFQDLAIKPIPERYWAIPLAIISTSISYRTASAYAISEVSRRSDRHLLLWRIHVVELDPELLQIYHEKYPSGVVSTICAVPIHELSQFPEEEEVLLRGPFFQLIRLQEENLEGVGNVHVMDLVMLSTNRDHPSTMELGKAEGEKAAQLFSCLIGIGRARMCERLADEYGLVDDGRQYDLLHEEGREMLKNYTV